jgi:Spy/CpxP family protein refolding chaperone
MRRKLVVAAWVATVSVLMSSTAVAQQLGAGRDRQRMMKLMQRVDQATRWWDRPQVAEQIGISDEQKNLLEAAADEALERRRAASREFSRIYVQLVDALSASEPDHSEIRKLRRDVESSSASLAATSVDHLLAMREILTKEQWSTLRETHPGALRPGQAGIRGVKIDAAPGGASTQPD